MASLLVEALLACAVSVIWWKLFREYFVKSPLDEIPGPPSSSLLLGECFGDPFFSFSARIKCWSAHVSTGNIGDVHNPNAWKYHYDVFEKCELGFPLLEHMWVHEGDCDDAFTDGSIMTMRGLLGVSPDIFFFNHLFLSEGLCRKGRYLLLIPKPYTTSLLRYERDTEQCDIVFILSPLALRINLFTKRSPLSSRASF